MENQWSQIKVQQYIDNDVEESLALEYKAAEALSKTEGKKTEITKDVSAMANSAGGLIIYGIKEHDKPDKRHLPEKLDPIDRTLFPKEWLEQVINNIRPRVSGIIIHSVSVDTGTDDVVYLVDIPQSSTAHQANDFRYYKRFNFQSVPMADFEIRDVMNRATTPDASIEFRHHKKQITPLEHTYRLEILVKNLGSQVINHFQVEFTFPRVVRNQHLSFKGKDNIDLRSTELGDYLIVYRSKMVLFPNEERDIGLEMIWEYDMNTETYGQLRELGLKGEEASVVWTLYADNMLPKKGRVLFSKLHNF